MYVCTYVRVCMYGCMYVWMYVCMCACVRACLRVCVCRRGVLTEANIAGLRNYFATSYTLPCLRVITRVKSENYKQNKTQHNNTTQHITTQHNTIQHNTTQHIYTHTRCNTNSRDHKSGADLLALSRSQCADAPADIPVYAQRWLTTHDTNRAGRWTDRQIDRQTNTQSRLPSATAHYSRHKPCRQMDR